MIRRTWLPLTILTLAAACDCGGPGIGVVNRPTLEFTEPEPMSVVLSEEELTIRSIGRNPAGVNAVVLRIGETEIANCEAEGIPELECEASIIPGDFEGELVEGELHIEGEVFGPGSKSAETLRLVVQTTPTELVILTPVDNGAVVVGFETDFIAEAKSDVGLNWLELLLGETELKRCELEGETYGQCSTIFDINDFPDQLREDNTLEITARTQTRRGVVSEVTHTLRVSPLAIRFVRPQVNLSNPPRAGVSGISPLELRLASTHPVEHIKVDALAEGLGVIFHKESNPDQKFRRDIPWGERLGTGEFLLTATILDNQGNTDTAELLVRVSCRNDGDCGDGTRCCPQTGTCHDIVAPGAICDCQNPCPTDQGCFPGICGQAPRRCRPGCFPGGPSDAPEDKAEACAPQNVNNEFVAAHCEKLPEAEVTAENRGGACVPSDPCELMVPGSCPDLPLDRTLPPGPGNEPVPHTCVPASPTTNKCVPVGSKVLGDEGCGFGLCGKEAQAQGCEEGLICAFITLENGVREPARCIQQCVNDDDCSGVEVCLGVTGPGGEPYQTGVCHLPI